MNIQTLIPSAKPIPSPFMASGKFTVSQADAEKLCAPVPLPLEGYARIVQLNGAKLSLVNRGQGRWTVETIFN